MFRRSCCELPVLARMARFVWSPGERFCAEILVPNYSAADACMDVHWALEQEDGATVAQGCFSQVSLTQGTVTRCGHAEALLPDGESPCVLFLRLRLSGACAAPGAPLVNDYRLWVLPAQAPAAPAGLCLTRSFDDAACRALQEGKTMLILSEGTPGALPRSRAVSFRPDFWSPMFHTDRPDGYSLGVWIDRKHPLFHSFPTDLFADWQWYEPLQHARGLLINDLPAALRPIVQPIATIDLPDRLALLLEARVGAGRVFVCTIDLLQKRDAASRQLLRAIYAYLTGSDFSPQASLSPDELRRLLPPLDLTGIGLSGPDALRTGESARCSVSFFDSHGERPAPGDAVVSLHSCAPSVVSIDETGLMHTLGSGIAKITARCVRAGRSFQAELVVRVNERQAAALPLSGAVLTASSTNPEHPLANLLNDDPDAFWQSDYLDRTQRMPQWLCVELPQETLISAVRCSPWRGHTRGAILRAAVSLSRDGVQFREVCRREWGEAHVFDNRLPVILSTGEQRMADLVWSCGPYRPDAPSLCEITGSVFVEGGADPARLRVRQLVRVLPKDMTTPPDKTALYQAMQRLQQAARTAEDGRRAQLETLLTRAESFNALTGAVQHDVDVWTDRLLDALAPSAGVL